MKKIVLMVLAIFIATFTLTGCNTDPYYQAGKSVYKGGKEIVKQNKEKLSFETQEKLKKIDEYATTYDKGRTVVKDTIEHIKNKKEK